MIINKRTVESSSLLVPAAFLVLAGVLSLLLAMQSFGLSGGVLILGAVAALPLGLISLWFFLKRPWLFAAGLLIYTPFEEFFVKWFSPQIQSYLRYLPEVALIGFCILLILLSWYKKKRFYWYRNPVDIPLLFFLFFVILSTVINDVPYFVTLASLKNLVRYIFLFYLLLFCNLTHAQIRWATYAIIIIAGFQGLLGLIELIVGSPVAVFLRSEYTPIELLTGTQNFWAGFAKSKPSGTVGLYISYGVYLVLWSTFCLCHYLINKDRRFLLLYGLMLIGIVASRARTSWVLVIFGFYITFLFTRPRTFIRLAYLTLLVGVIGVSIGILGSVNIGQHGSIIGHLSLIDQSGAFGFRPESIWERFAELLTYDYWRTSSRFLTLFITLPEILANYPLLGLGPGTMASAVTGGGSTSTGLYPEFSHQHWLDVPNHIVIWAADTGFVAMIAQFGLLGLSCWLIIFGRFLFIAARLARSSTLVFNKIFATATVISIILVYFVTEFGGHYITYRSVSIYLWYIFAVLIYLRRQQAGLTYYSTASEKSAHPLIL